mmetsp:Transcript_2242/g.3145  ORF Transcript_2242/g.3145 Transcript_2242/m.3145 type:complete len:787 (+) Transcript_2242:88-2448(+)
MIFCKPWAQRITNTDGGSSSSSGGLHTDDSILAKPIKKHQQDTYDVARMKALLQELTFGVGDHIMMEAGAAAVATTVGVPLTKRRSKNRHTKKDRHHHRKKKSKPPTKKSGPFEQKTMKEALSPTEEDHRQGQVKSSVSTWKTAIDPASGRTYYYDSVSRRTQWEKPPEIRAMERAKRKEKRRLDKLFFAEMEQNIYDSLARGECIPSSSSSSSSGSNHATSTSTTSNSDTKSGNEKNQNQHEPQSNHPYTKQQQSYPRMIASPKTNSQRITEQRVRTISGMDEMLLNELSVAQPDRAGGIPVVRPEILTAAKPELVTRTRSATTTTNSYNENSNNNATDLLRGRPPRAPDYTSNSSPHSRIYYPRRADSMELSPDETGRKKGAADNIPREESDLAGEYLLDSPLPPSSTVRNHNSGDVSSLPKDPEEAEPKQLPISKPAPIHMRRNTGGTIYLKSTMTNPNVEATIKCVCGVFRAHILQAFGKRHQRSYLTQPHLAEIIPVFNDFTTTPSLSNHHHHQQQQLQLNNSANMKIPSLDEICMFYQDFYKRSQMEHDTIIMSLIYVERLIKETHGALSPTPQNWMSVLFSCMVLASKVWDDLSMWNIDFSNVCGRHGRKCVAFAPFTLRRINQLEVAVLKALNFCVRVPASEYAKYYFLIRSMLIKSGLLDESAAASISNSKNNNDSGDNSGGYPGLQEQQKQFLDMQGAKNLETLSTNYQDTFQGNHNRRAKSMDGFFGFFAAQQEQTVPLSGVDSQANNPESSSWGAGAGPVLKQSICLEQLVSMK